MAKGQLEQIVSQANMLLQKMPDEAQMEGWVQSKLTIARELIDTVFHYLVDEVQENVEDDRGLDEKKKGLWDNIHAKRKRGEPPAKPGDEDYPDREAWKKAQND
jgi:uncharacterized membrane protein required for colicin V production